MNDNPRIKERYKVIQQRLVAIAETKERSQEDRVRSSLTERVEELEGKVEEAMDHAERKHSVISEELGELKVKQRQVSRKMQLALKMRSDKIREIKAAIFDLLSEQQSSDSSRLAYMQSHFDQQSSQIVERLKTTRKESNSEYGRANRQVDTRLDEMQQQIQAQEQFCRSIHKQSAKAIMQHVKDYQENWENRDKNRKQSIAHVTKLIEGAAEEIAADWQQHKLQRESTRDKLLSMIALLSRKMQ